MKRIAVFGAGGCGRGIMPLVREQWAASEENYDLVFVDDHPSAHRMNGHPILTYQEWLAQPAEEHLITIAIANSAIRQRLVERCEADNVRFLEVRGKNVVILDDVSLGKGAVLCPFVTITSNIKIGRHFHANLYSYVEHDCVIGDFVTFAPAVRCNGNVVIEDHAYIGAGAVLKHGTPNKPLVIGKGAIVGMGAVVTKDVPPGTTVVGNPASQLKKDPERA
jgi:sugar O-acyltransferase (sialic acid O-acetyltransferase NeuD family)